MSQPTPQPQPPRFDGLVFDADGNIVGTVKPVPAPPLNASIPAPAIGELNHSFLQGMRTTAAIQGRRAVPQF